MTATNAPVMTPVPEFLQREEIVPAPVVGAAAEKLSETLAQQYRDEAKGGPRRGWVTPDDLATDSGLVARLDRLVALSLQAARRKPATRMAPPAQLAWNYSAFSRTIADFVTEKDLIGSGSLHNVGRTTPSAKRAGRGQES